MRRRLGCSSADRSSAQRRSRSAPGAPSGVAAPRYSDLPGKSRDGIGVDVELVLAVDVSYSMDPDEQKLQREGYIEAITSREFINALRRACTARSPSPI